MHATTTTRADRWIQRLASALVVLGVVAALWGAAYVLNGATQALAPVKVQVGVLSSDGEGWGDERVSLEDVGLASGWLAGARPTGLAVGANAVDGHLTLAAPDSTRTEQALARGDWLVVGLALLVGALALRPVLHSIAAANAFAPGNARRITVLAATVAVAGVVAPLLPEAAARLALSRLDLEERLTVAGSLPVEPLLVAAVLLAVAAAFRQGERQSRDLEGLV